MASKNRRGAMVFITPEIADALMCSLVGSEAVLEKNPNRAALAVRRYDVAINSTSPYDRDVFQKAVISILRNGE